MLLLFDILYVVLLVLQTLLFVAACKVCCVAHDLLIYLMHVVDASVRSNNQREVSVDHCKDPKGAHLYPMFGTQATAVQLG